MPVEVVVKEHEIAIYIDKIKMRQWLGVTDVPWEEADKTSDPHNQETQQAEVNKRAEELRKEDEKAGYKNVEGEKKEFPNQVKGDHIGTSEERVDGIDLFDEGPTGQKGTLQDAPKGKDKIKEVRDWLRDKKFNYQNFCNFLYDLDELAGFKLSTPLIGVTKQKKPTLLQVAFRFYSYWLSAKDDIAKQYSRYLVIQLDDMGVRLMDAKGMVIKELDGVEIDPKKLPKGVEVSP